MKKALILGVTGQDGSYLAEVLLEKDYEVHGMIRRSATGNTRNIDHLISNPDIYNKHFYLCRGDLTDPTSIYRIIENVKPDEIYNEADQDHVMWSYDMVGYSSDVTGSAVGRILEIIRQLNPAIRFFQPCTSNMFGLTQTDMQDEETVFNPRSPYACAKVMAFYLTRYYRESFGMFASVAILYNHESPRRTPEYLTRKVTQSVARILHGKQNKLFLGELSTRIDWGYAKEYMEAAWQILQLDKPDEFIIATGESHSVQEWVDESFASVKLNSKDHVITDPALLRPTKTSSLVGDISKARNVFGFNPKVRFKELINIMIEHDVLYEKIGRGIY